VSQRSELPQAVDGREPSLEEGLVVREPGCEIECLQGGLGRGEALEG
jgi:hypothetical protein